MLELGAVGAEPGFERKLVAALGQVGRNVEHQPFGIVDSQQRDGGGHAQVGGVDQREQAQPRAVGIDTAYLRACDVEDAAGGDGAVGLARGHVFHQADVGAAHVAHDTRKFERHQIRFGTLGGSGDHVDNCLILRRVYHACLSEEEAEDAG